VPFKRNLRQYTVWQCLNDLVTDALRHAEGSTGAQIAWEHLTRDFFGSKGGGGGPRLRNRAVHRSKASLLSEYRLRLADGAMKIVATVAAAADAERRRVQAANERMHQQSLELVALKEEHAASKEYISTFLGDGKLITHTKDRIANAVEENAALKRVNKTLEDSVARMTAELDAIAASRGGGGGRLLAGAVPGMMRDEARREYELKIATLAAGLSAAERARDEHLSRAGLLHKEGVQLRYDLGAARDAAEVAAAATVGTASVTAGVRGELERQLAAASLDASSYKAECERRAAEGAAAEARVDGLEADLELRALDVSREKAFTRAAQREAEQWRAEVGYYRQHRSVAQVADVTKWSNERAAEAAEAEARSQEGEAGPPLRPGQQDAEYLERVRVVALHSRGLSDSLHGPHRLSSTACVLTARVGLSLPGVRLVTRHILAVIN
jgi:hypothetical protein